MHDELGERGVERVVGEGKLLGRRESDVDARVARAGPPSTNGSDGSTAATFVGPERARRAPPVSAPGPQPDVETLLPGRDPCEVRKLRAESEPEYRPMNRS